MEIKKIEKLPGLHVETISKYFNVNGKDITFTHQKTPANCGPLSIINGISALEKLNPDFKFAKDFPRTSGGIRKILSEDQELRKTIFGDVPREEIQKDNYSLSNFHIINLIQKFLEGSDLKITGDRFTGVVPVPIYRTGEVINNSDWVVYYRANHFTSFVRFDQKDWIFLDSMNERPLIVTQEYVKDICKDVPSGKSYTQSMFVSLKIKDKITIIKK